MPEGFNNSVVGGADKLIRVAIQSPNYVPGSDGWSLNKDGTAEFLEAIIRGLLDVLGADGSRVRIAANGGVAQITILPGGTTLSEELFAGSIVGSSDTPLDEGYITIYGPAFAGQQNARIIFGASTTLDCFMTLDGDVQIQLLASNSIDLTSLLINLNGVTTISDALTAAGITISGNQDLTIGNTGDILNSDGSDRYGRGRVNFVSSSGDINLTTTPAVAFTLPSFTYKAGRAYEARMYARYVDGDSPSVFLRKGTTTGGTVVVDAGRVPLPINNTLTFETPMPFIVGGSDVTTQLNVTMTSLNTTTQAGPRKVEVWDIGPASLYSDFSANTLS